MFCTIACVRILGCIPNPTASSIPNGGSRNFLLAWKADSHTMHIEHKPQSCQACSQRCLYVDLPCLTGVRKHASRFGESRRLIRLRIRSCHYFRPILSDLSLARRLAGSQLAWVCPNRCLTSSGLRPPMPPFVWGLACCPHSSCASLGALLARDGSSPGRERARGAIGGAISGAGVVSRAPLRSSSMLLGAAAPHHSRCATGSTGWPRPGTATPSKRLHHVPHVAPRPSRPASGADWASKPSSN